jgi:hypothetical protein
LCIISWLAWFLVACVVSKKFIKFLRKSLKKFDLKLKRNGLKMKFEKEKKKKKKTSPAPLSAQTAQRPVGQHPRWPTSPPLLFLFSPRALTPGPRLSASPFPFPFFFFPSLPNRPGAAAQSPPRNPRRARPPPTFPSSLHGQLRQSNFPVINLAVTSHP